MSGIAGMTNKLHDNCFIFIFEKNVYEYTLFWQFVFFSKSCIFMLEFLFFNKGSILKKEK